MLAVLSAAGRFEEAAESGWSELGPCTTLMSPSRSPRRASPTLQDEFEAAGSIAAASKPSNPPLSRRRPLKTGAALAFGDQIRFFGTKKGPNRR